MARIVTANPRSQPGQFLTQAGYAAFGQGSPTEQVGASVALATAAYLSSLISFGATIIFALLFTGTAFVGVIRFVAAEADVATETVFIIGPGLFVAGIGLVAGASTLMLLGAGIVVVGVVFEFLARR